MRIFVGSSSDAKLVDTEVRTIMENHPTAKPIPWHNTFTPGEFGLESLKRIKSEVDAALLIMTVDDKIWYRGAEGFSPRDNVLFELGYFLSEFGREKVGILVVKDEHGNSPKIPTDLAGLNFIQFNHGKLAGNESSITKWLFHLAKFVKSGKSELGNPFEVLESQYSKLPNNWKDDVKNYLIEPFKKQSLDALSGEFSLSIAQYYNSLFAAISTSEDTNTTIRAISLLSEDFWEQDPFQAQYLNYNIQASKKGTTIKRLFIINRRLHAGLWKTIQKQLDHGIEVRVVESKVFSRFTNLDDMVIIEKADGVRSYISKQFFSNTNRLKSANLNLNPTHCKEFMLSFDSVWELSAPPKPSIVTKEQESSDPPGRKLEVFNLPEEVISCESAAIARNVPLKNELKSLILETSNGHVCVHIPGDGKLSLRAVKNALDIKEARIADPEALYKLGLSPGTVSAVLEPVWSMPHLISRRVLTNDFITTNNGTRTQYFKFDPIRLLEASSYLLGQFEK